MALRDRFHYFLPYRSVYTILHYPIDVVYLSKGLVDIDDNLPPGKFGKRLKDACSVLELPTRTDARIFLCQNKYLG